MRLRLDNYRHWSLGRARNKPHIFYFNGEWRVILRPNFEYQTEISKPYLWEARRFIQRLNSPTYRRIVERRTNQPNLRG